MQLAEIVETFMGRVHFCSRREPLLPASGVSPISAVIAKKVVAGKTLR